MKTGVLEGRPEAAPIVQLIDEHPDAATEAAQLLRARPRGEQYRECQTAGAEAQ